MESNLKARCNARLHAFYLDCAELAWSIGDHDGYYDYLREASRLTW